jgi:hypothetical protein
MNIGMTRISSVGQKENTSLSNQKKMITDYCSIYNIELDEIIEEVYTGTTSDRDGLNRVKSFVEQDDDLLNDVYYYGISWGGKLGPLFLANDKRIKKAVWQVAGLGARETRPEGNPLTFLSRINKPVLMLNGIYDQYFPFETSQKPMYELLSLKEPMKKMITYKSAHSPPSNQTSKEVLKWFK